MTKIPNHTSVMKEIEYKYQVDIEACLAYIASNEKHALRIEDIEQHYIAKENGNTVRLRVSHIGEYVERVLCIKSNGADINEAEEGVSEAFADAIISDNFKTSKVNKRRVTFAFDHDGHILKLEIDVYKDKLVGLIIAEVEVPHKGFEIPSEALPSFVIRKMTRGESKYLSNYALSLMERSEIESLIYHIKK